MNVMTKKILILLLLMMMSSSAITHASLRGFTADDDANDDKEDDDTVVVVGDDDDQLFSNHSRTSERRRTPKTGGSPSLLFYCLSTVLPFLIFDKKFINMICNSYICDMHCLHIICIYAYMHISNEALSSGEPKPIISNIGNYWLRLTT